MDIGDEELTGNGDEEGCLEMGVITPNSSSGSESDEQHSFESHGSFSTSDVDDAEYGEQTLAPQMVTKNSSIANNDFYHASVHRQNRCFGASMVVIAGSFLAAYFLMGLTFTPSNIGIFGDESSIKGGSGEVGLDADNAETQEIVDEEIIAEEEAGHWGDKAHTKAAKEMKLHVEEKLRHSKVGKNKWVENKDWWKKNSQNLDKSHMSKKELKQHEHLTKILKRRKRKKRQHCRQNPDDAICQRGAPDPDIDSIREKLAEHYNYDATGQGKESFPAPNEGHDREGGKKHHEHKNKHNQKHGKDEEEKYLTIEAEDVTPREGGKTHHEHKNKHNHKHEKNDDDGTGEDLAIEAVDVTPGEGGEKHHEHKNKHNQKHENNDDDDTGDEEETDLAIESVDVVPDNDNGEDANESVQEEEEEGDEPVAEEALPDNDNGEDANESVQEEEEEGDKPVAEEVLPDNDNGEDANESVQEEEEGGQPVTEDMLPDNDNSGSNDKEDHEGAAEDVLSGSENTPAEENIYEANDQTQNTIIDTFTVLEQVDHDQTSFTQGLSYSSDGKVIFETTGLNGQSKVRRINPETFDVELSVNTDARFFGEGSTFYTDANGNERLIEITWKAQTGFIYDAKTLDKLEEFQYTTSPGPRGNQGWGITYDLSKQEFIVSDGSKRLYFWDRDSLEEKRNVIVTRFDGSEQDQLNELEYMDGLVCCNIWHSDHIICVDPDTGMSVREYDMSSLWPVNQRGSRENVLNGIALGKDHVLLTGKRWDRMYKVVFPDWTTLF